ncbi:MAG: sugar phosphate isomerase/epimerase [Chloroflexi bacterium]|nr:sugar phosphate isomerase/epimerase [Chloroflexota bacterium]
MQGLKVGVFADNMGLGVWDGMKKAAEIGADGVQFYTTSGPLSPENLPKEKRADVAKLLADLGLTLSATCSDFGQGLVDEAKNRDLIPRIKANIDLALDLGTTIITTHIGHVPADKNDPVWGVLVKALEEVGAYADSVGAVLATETGPEEGVTLVSLIESLKTRAIRVNFDPANFIIYGYDHRAAVDALRPYIVHTHAKDAKGKLEVPLGQGDVDFPWYVGKLRSFGYDGFYTIEREVGPDPIGDIQQAIAFLRAL